MAVKKLSESTNSWKTKLSKELNNQINDKGLEMTIRKLIFRNCSDKDIEKAMKEYMPEYFKEN